MANAEQRGVVNYEAAAAVAVDPGAGCCPGLAAALIGLTPDQVVVLKNLVRAGLLHNRPAGEEVPEGVSLQPCLGTHIVARVHLRKGNIRATLNLYTGGSYDIETRKLEP